MDNTKRSIAFLVYPVLRFPRNNREYYLTRELLSRGWRVAWLVPESGTNEGVPVEDCILRYKDLDVRGRTYLLPLYLAIMLSARGVNYLWLSGWSIRADREIFWLVRIMGMFGIETVYDTIDPKCVFEVANKNLTSPDAIRSAQESINEIYGLCRRVLCVTPEMKALLVHDGADERKLFVARWGVDRSIFNRAAITGDLRSRLGIGKNTFLVGWLGSMTEFKGLREMLLPLVDRLGAENNIHFLIAGDGPLFAEVEEWVASAKRASVTLLGRVPYEDAAEFTAALDAYIVTTNPDSDYARAICPVKCCDAIAMGTPLITTRTPATEYLEQTCRNVHLCEYDIFSFEAAVKRIAADLDGVRTSRTDELCGVVSHQGVSREIADILDELAEGNN